MNLLKSRFLKLLPLLLLPACGGPSLGDSEVSQDATRVCIDLGELPPAGIPTPPAPTHEVCPLAGQSLRTPVYGKYGCQFPENQGGWAHAGQGVGYDPANRRYRKEVNGKAWEWVYFYDAPAGWAYVPGEDLVRKSDGGCAARYGAQAENPNPAPAPGPLPATDKGSQFAQWYLDNYQRVAAEVGHTAKACSLYLTTALNLWGGAGQFVQHAWAETHVEVMMARGWNIIPARSQPSRLKELKVGDIVSTADEQTRRTHVTDHVFVITGIIEPGVWVYATDNRGRHYKRPLLGDGRGDLADNVGYSPFWEGFRIK